MNQEEEWLLAEKYHGDVNAEEFQNDCLRLSQGVPLAYLIGSIPFLNTTIHLDSHPLIPRTETEYWVEKAIAEIQSHTSLPDTHSIRILDLCAGSGCIGVAVLKAVSVARVDFAEIDTRHHTTILKNLSINNIDTSRAQIFGGSLFSEITGTFDFILTNPPYIDATLNRVSTNVSAHEPSLALYGGTEGVDIITKIIESASSFLTPTGVLYIEHEPEQSEYICNLASKHGYISSTYTDQFNVLRYTRITRALTHSVSQ